VNVKRTRPERVVPDQPDKEPSDGGPDERDIDQVLADSFPASDAPPWTLGVTKVPEAKRRRDR
jgi:hypothetical protein